MGSKTDYLENKVLDHVLRNTSYTPAATVYLALFTADPTDTGSLTNEVTGGSYARQAITFGAASGGQVSNSTLISFPTPTANWGTVTHWGIADAVSAGNLLYHGAMTTSRACNIGDTVEVAIGDIIVTED